MFFLVTSRPRLQDQSRSTLICVGLNIKYYVFSKLKRSLCLQRVHDGSVSRALLCAVATALEHCGGGTMQRLQVVTLRALGKRHEPERRVLLARRDRKEELPSL